MNGAAPVRADAVYSLGVKTMTDPFNPSVKEMLENLDDKLSSGYDPEIPPNSPSQWEINFISDMMAKSDHTQDMINKIYEIWERHFK